MVVPKAKGEKDVLLLLCLGNEVFLKEEHYFSNGRCHLESPAYHNDATAAVLIDNLCRTLSQVQATFKGAIKICGPLPRHLVKCCKKPSHTIAKSTVFLSTLHYIELWNNFLAVHPKLRVFKNTEFIPYQQIFGDVFHNGWLLDGVHLDEIPNYKLASFIGTLPGRGGVGVPDPLPAEVTSFTTWAAMQPKPRSVSGGGGKAKQSVATSAPNNVSSPPSQSAAGAGGQAGTAPEAANGGSSGESEKLPDYESEMEEDGLSQKSGGDKDDMEIEEQMRSFDKACDQANGQIQI